MPRAIDVAGKKFNRLTVIRRVGIAKNGAITWLCVCDCGNEVVVMSVSLRSGNTQSCGCMQREAASRSGKATAADLTGQRFARLTALNRTDEGNNGKPHWLCHCDCGNQTTVAAGNLQNGHTRSCGCLKYEVLLEKATKHGKCETSEYSTWESMIKRCHNPNHIFFHNYGGRGITVCERWRHSFENFYQDMGQKPLPTLTLDRIDNEGNYEPDNCRWVTRSENNSNTRRNKKYANTKG